MSPRLLQLALLATIGATQLAAQTEPPTGLAALSVGGGGGIGALKATCSGCPGYQSTAHSARLVMARLGFANTSQSIIGFEYDNWRRTKTIALINPVTLDPTPSDQTTSVSWFDVTAQWYPMARGALAGLHVKGAIGLTTFRVDPGATVIKSIGGGGGLGYDVWFTKLLAVTPSVDMLAAQRAEEPRQPRDLQHARHLFGASMTSVSLAIKFRGIP